MTQHFVASRVEFYGENLFLIKMKSSRRRANDFAAQFCFFFLQINTPISFSAAAKV